MQGDLLFQPLWCRMLTERKEFFGLGCHLGIDELSAWPMTENPLVVRNPQRGVVPWLTEEG
jgi:hypothetical protein